MRTIIVNTDGPRGPQGPTGPQSTGTINQLLFTTTSSSLSVDSGCPSVLSDEI